MTPVATWRDRRTAGETAQPPAVRRRRRVSSEARAAALFLLPAAALLIGARLIPIVSAVIDSLKTSALSLQGSHFAGLHNFRVLLADPGFHKTLAVTGIFLLVIVPFQIIIAFFLALFLVERFPGVGIARMLVFLPVAAPAAVASVVWGIAYQPQGPLNGLAHALGLPAQPFLTSPHQALACLVVLMSWIGIGYWTLFLIAGLQDIPRELYEAAAIDGAGWWRSLSRITLPNLRRTLAFIVVADTVASATAFVPVQVLTQGGPAQSTNLIMFNIYNQAYTIGNINVGQAQVVLLLIVLIAVTALQFRLLSKEH